MDERCDLCGETDPLLHVGMTHSYRIVDGHPDLYEAVVRRVLECGACGKVLASERRAIPPMVPGLPVLSFVKPPQRWLH